MAEKRTMCAGMQAFGWWLISLVGLLFLLAGIIISKQSDIENDLLQRTQHALSDQKVSWAVVTTRSRGRDVLITGAAPNQERYQQALDVVQAVYGVRSVKSAVSYPELAQANVIKNTADLVPHSKPQVGSGNQKQSNDLIVTQSDSGEKLAGAVGKHELTPIEEGDTSAMMASTQQQALLGETGEPSSDKESAEKTPLGRNTTEEKPASVLTPVDLKQQEKSCQKQLDSAMKNKSVRFATNQAVIRKDSYQLLDSIARVMAECKAVLKSNAIKVGGHTDSIGSAQLNLRVSQQRAESVKQYLIKKGIDGAAIEAKGYGESKPVSSNKTERGRSRNRRITFELN